jgi:hypothetical protein
MGTPLQNIPGIGRKKQNQTMRTLFIVLTTLVLIALAASSAHAEKRMALIIGNKNYPAGSCFGPLDNPHNDAHGMASVLRQHGFTTAQVLLDQDKGSMLRQIERFGRASAAADVRLLYFSGHGIRSLDGQYSYLIPTGHSFSSGSESIQHGIRTDILTDNLAYHKTGANIVIVDACQNRWTKGNGSAPLMMHTVPQGTLIAFASQWEASDGPTGKYGLFTGHLIEEITRSNQSIRDILYTVREQVAQETEAAQIPWVVDMMLGSIFLKNNAAHSHNARPINKAPQHEPTPPPAPMASPLTAISPNGKKIARANGNTLNISNTTKPARTKAYLFASRGIIWWRLLLIAPCIFAFCWGIARKQQPGRQAIPLALLTTSVLLFLAYLGKAPMGTSFPGGDIIRGYNDNPIVEVAWLSNSELSVQLTQHGAPLQISGDTSLSLEDSRLHMAVDINDGNQLVNIR